MEVKITLTDQQVEEILSQKKTPPKEEQKDTYLSVKQVCEILGISESTVRKHIKSGLLTYTKFGGSYRISRKQLQDYANRTQ